MARQRLSRGCAGGLGGYAGGLGSLCPVRAPSPCTASGCAMLSPSANVHSPMRCNRCSVPKRGVRSLGSSCVASFEDLGSSRHVHVAGNCTLQARRGQTSSFHSASLTSGRPGLQFHSLMHMHAYACHSCIAEAEWKTKQPSSA